MVLIEVLFTLIYLIVAYFSRSFKAQIASLQEKRRQIYVYNTYKFKRIICT
jgi:hypothetical protein